MGLKTAIGYVLLLVISYVSFEIFKTICDGEPFELNPNPYWGKDQPPKDSDESIRTFKINVEEKVLEDWKERLKRELEGDRFREPLEGIGFQYGFNSNFLKNLSAHWLQNYNWREREMILNTYPHFKTKIAGIDIHFQHVKKINNKKKKYVPLLMLHGYPGSFVEFQKAIPLLLKSEINFELVIPSLPGFGFSEGGHKTGLGPVEMGQIFLKLMQRLGHDIFYIQGGDWGSIIATNMAALYPKNVKGIHLNMCISMHPRGTLRELLASVFPSFLMTEDERKKFIPIYSKRVVKNIRESGYLHEVATKPDTVGAGLTQSPSGLAAYMLDRIPIGTNEEWLSKGNGGIIPYYNLDEWLDDIMIYWVTNSITTSIRLYSEALSSNSKQWAINRVPVKVPTAYLNVPNESVKQTYFTLGDKYPNIVRHTKAAKGGHYAAFEVPDIFAEDVIASIRFLENMHQSKKQEL